MGIGRGSVVLLAWGAITTGRAVASDVQIDGSSIATTQQVEAADSISWLRHACPAYVEHEKQLADATFKGLVTVYERPAKAYRKCEAIFRMDTR